MCSSLYYGDLRKIEGRKGAFMQIYVTKDYQELSEAAADTIVDLVEEKPGCVLGLATGSTPEGLYAEIVKRHQAEGVDFSRVATFNLDEYRGLPADHEQSYRYFMNKHLFSKNYGMGGALSVFLFVITGVLSLIVFRFNKSTDGR